MITYLELLQKFTTGEQPEVVKFDGEEFEYEPAYGDYIHRDKRLHEEKIVILDELIPMKEQAIKKSIEVVR